MGIKDKLVDCSNKTLGEAVMEERVKLQNIHANEEV